MADDAQMELTRSSQVEATAKNLEGLRRAASRKSPTREELAALREEVKARRVEDDVKIVELDGPMQIWAWLCKRHRENLKPGWYVKSMKDQRKPAGMRQVHQRAKVRDRNKSRLLEVAEGLQIIARYAGDKFSIATCSQ